MARALEDFMAELITIGLFGLSLLLTGVFKKKIICVNLDEIAKKEDIKKDETSEDVAKQIEKKFQKSGE